MITVRVPATSANCCIGFDSLGMALDWLGKFTFSQADALQITGCPKEYAGEDNLVYRGFVKAFEAAGQIVPPVHIHIDSSIPFARGLGSSSSCIAAGIIGANAWMGYPLTDAQTLQIAARLEGHPDNAAPALFGGLCICTASPQGIAMRSLDLEGWKALALIPQYEVSTPEARKVLPDSVSLKDAAAQCGNAMLFEYALQTKDEALLKSVCKDVLHEPYRKNLIQEYDWCKALADEMGLPFWISGSGPTLLFCSLDADRLHQAAKLLEEQFGQSVMIREMKIFNGKAQVEYV